jgi:hypothetical protein
MAHTNNTKQLDGKATNLRNCRLKRGMPVVKLAVLADVSVATCHRADCYGQKVSRCVAKRIAKALRVPLKQAFPYLAEGA